MADWLTMRPRLFDGLLINPGIGLMTFQRFNGDPLNGGTGWTEGHPLQRFPDTSALTDPAFFPCSLSYFRIYWRFLEPEPEQYSWELIDGALERSARRGQTMFLRVAPYGPNADEDVPDWFRAQVGPAQGLPEPKWRCDPEDPRYLERFGGFVRALARRYDGHPALEAVDISINSFWGEGESSELLSGPTREALMDAYLKGFTQTQLIVQLTDLVTNRYALSKCANVGWRADCLGDMGGFGDGWSHMLDGYPRQIIEFGMADVWKTGPVSLEVCWVMLHWLAQEWDLQYIIDQSLKWHVSSLNAKSSAVPPEYRPAVERWLGRMGYRLAPRSVSHEANAAAGGQLQYRSWWENLGSAPCYRQYPLAFRLSGERGSRVIATGHDMRALLPGDSLVDGSFTVPGDLPPGSYSLEWAMLGLDGAAPAVRFGIEGRRDDGWYPLGPVQIGV